MNIRKFLCSAVAISIIAISNAFSIETSLGVKGGINLTGYYGEGKYWNGDGKEKQTVKPGMVIGAALQLKLANMFAIEPEVLYSQKGQKLTENGGHLEFCLNYIEFPVLAQFLIPLPVQVVVPMIYMGPAFAFRAGHVVIRNNDGSEFSGNDIDGLFSGFDIGLAFGCGTELKTGFGNIVFDIRYTLGFINARKIADEMKALGISGSNVPAIKNSVLMFAAGYLYTF
jgi:hypothetical protein